MHLYSAQDPQDTFAVNREEPFTSSGRGRMQSGKQTSSPNDYRTTLENQFQRQNMYQEGNKTQRQINQPLLFSIDYILNLAVKEQHAVNQQQQQQQQHAVNQQQQSYLSRLAYYQQYHHHLNQRQQQQQPLDQQTHPQQKDNYQHQHEQAQDCRKKKTRTVFTKPQVMHLESVFRTHKYLTCFERSRLASSMNLSDTQIKIWFQNRRNKFKREHLIPPLTMSSMMWEQQANKDL